MVASARLSMLIVSAAYVLLESTVALAEKNGSLVETVGEGRLG